VLHSSKATYGDMAHSVVELMVVLTNLTPFGCRGESCACPGVASRVAVGASRFGHCPYTDSRVQLTECRRMHNSGCGDVLSSWGSHSVGDGTAVHGMIAQRRGCPHRARGDRGDALHWPDVTVSSRMSVRLASVTLSRVPPSYFEGCDMEAVQKWAA
jgi:hypothetical protein